MAGLPQIVVDFKRHGLPCRAPGRRCVTFSATHDTPEDIAAAARQRDAHEVRVHGYAHVRYPVTKADYAMGIQSVFRPRGFVRKTQ